MKTLVTLSLLIFVGCSSTDTTLNSLDIPKPYALCHLKAVDNLEINEPGFFDRKTSTRYTIDQNSECFVVYE